MFTEALNAPWLLIILYLLPLGASGIMWWRWIGKSGGRTVEVCWLVLCSLLLGAGLALLGAAYLHDVWYC